MVRVERELGGRLLTIETGKLAKQADGAVVVRYGDTVVLVTVVAGPEVSMDFLPLTVEYRERMHAAGKIPGGPYYRREGRPSQKETLTMRMMDRPLRPLFPKGWKRDTQVIASVLSADKENDPDFLSVIAASAAVSISPIPFGGPIGTVSVGRVGGQFILNPTHQQVEESDLDIVVCGSKTRIDMIEAGAKQVPEQVIVDAVAFAQEHLRVVVELQEELMSRVGVQKESFEPKKPRAELVEAMRAKAWDEVHRRLQLQGKDARRNSLNELYAGLVMEYTGAHPDADPAELKEALACVEREAVRRLALEGKRCDGRALNEVREVACEVGILPRTHGSALFTRGETQALAVVTLGTGFDEEIVDGLLEEYKRTFMFHYYFPPFSTGEVKPIRAPSRREIGHGALAERALQAVLPEEARFPYTIRVVSEILESNGSSSMASVCGGSLALMDAGVPITAPVSGVAMGLIIEGEEHRILTDIIGEEDGNGDLDFKVAGSPAGITALQMDTKTHGIDVSLIAEVLEQAKEARAAILSAMQKAIDKPRAEISQYAPRLLQIKIDPEKIGLVIGTGGKTIKKIQADTGAELEVEDDGTITISSYEAGAALKAKARVEAIVEEPTVGRLYPEAEVTEIKDFGLIVEVAPGKDGLVHISELDERRVAKATDVAKVGDRIPVKVISIDEQGRLRLSRKAALRDVNRAGAPAAAPVVEIKVGMIIPEAEVLELRDFGAIVQVYPGKDGLVHISELDEKRVGKVADVVRVGDRIPVKVISIDSQGRFRLSRKAALREMNKRSPS